MCRTSALPIGKPSLRAKSRCPTATHYNIYQQERSKILSFSRRLDKISENVYDGGPPLKYRSSSTTKYYVKALNKHPSARLTGLLTIQQIANASATLMLAKTRWETQYDSKRCSIRPPTRWCRIRRNAYKLIQYILYQEHWSYKIISRNNASPNTLDVIDKTWIWLPSQIGPYGLT